MACRASGAATVADMPRVGGSATKGGARPISPARMAGRGRFNPAAGEGCVESAAVADMPDPAPAAIEDGACRGFDQIRARPPSAPAAARGGRTR